MLHSEWMFRDAKRRVEQKRVPLDRAQTPRPALRHALAAALRGLAARIEPAGGLAPGSFAHS